MSSSKNEHSDFIPMESENKISSNSDIESLASDTECEAIELPGG